MHAWKWLGMGMIGLSLAVVAVELTACAASEDSKKPAQQEANVKVTVFNKDGQLVGPVESARVVKTDAEWEKQLGAKTFAVVRAKGTERPFCGNLLDNHKEGVYVCVGCNLPLYSSDAKFNSGTGWPSFFKPVGDNVMEDADRSLGMLRVEILCARCGGHLGHVFEDGPAPTGRRHCVNSESLKFVDKADLKTLADPAAEKPATQPAK